MSKAKYIIGIDLGTSNIVVMSVPADSSEDSSPLPPQRFPILQEFAHGAIEERDTLPSFLFERMQEKHVLPWKRESAFIVGEYARERGAEVPARLISSAKSWLCNPRIDRKEAVLPWNAPAGARKISPVEAQSEFLAHVCCAWNEKHPKDKFEDQEIIITIPASFDAVSRDLTLEAAHAAGIEEVKLLEEPQAAFYAWISQTQIPWRRQVKKGDLVLVVDVGGGTTDFSLIEVAEKDGDLHLERVAVGNHILLGGDNMDLTLAFYVRQKLEAAKKKIDSWQTVALSHACRKAKEKLLTGVETKSEAVVIPGRGSGVVSGSLKSSLDRDEIEKILVDGFFPFCKIDDAPQENPVSGFKELHLAYAADPAVTRHLAAFLKSQAGKDGELRYPQAVLFNGGIFEAERFRTRLVEVIDSWLEAAGLPPIKVLEGCDLSGAVAAGATAFGLACHGKGVRIRGGVSQSYYIGIESALPAVPGYKPPLKALCVAAQGMEEGTSLDINDHTFGLIVGKPVEFKFFKSNCRREDKVGQLYDEIPPGVEETSSLSLELPAQEGVAPGSLVDVSLQVVVTEIGTLEIWCRDKSGKQKWKLEFNVRDAIK